MMVIWMCGRMESKVWIFAVFWVFNVWLADVVRRGRLRWFVHLERKNVDDWVSTCRNVNLHGRGEV